MFEELYRDPERLEQFMRAMAGISLANFETFAEKFDFSRTRRMCDVGGATGQLSIFVARTPPAHEVHHMRSAGGGADRAATIEARRAQRPDHRASVDIFSEPLPKADVITMGMILHDWNLEKKMQLIQLGLRRPAQRRRLRGDRESDR